MTSPSRFAVFRSYILLIAGLAAIGWEIVVEQSDRPTIIVAALLMMGISVPLNLDERTARWVALWRGAPPPTEDKTEVLK